MAMEESVIVAMSDVIMETGANIFFLFFTTRLSEVFVFLRTKLVCL